MKDRFGCETFLCKYSIIGRDRLATIPQLKLALGGVLLVVVHRASIITTLGSKHCHELTIVWLCHKCQ